MCCVPLACLLYSAVSCWQSRYVVRSSEDSDTRLLFQVLVHGRDPPPNSGGASATVPLPAAAARVDGWRPPSVKGGVTLYIANVGDCRAVLCRGGAAVRLSEDHKPNSREERARVEKAGGCVINCSGIWRVCTSASAAGLKLVNDDSLFLSTSRAFGDRKLKGVANRDLISAVPEVTAFSLRWEDLFFVVACDGVWDVLSDQQVIDIAGERLASAETAQAAAAAVVRAAYEASSLDNLTASVVQFGWHQQQGTPGSLRDGAKVIAAAMEKRQAKQRAEAAAKAKKIEADEIDMFA